MNKSTSTALRSGAIRTTTITKSALALRKANRQRATPRSRTGTRVAPLTPSANYASRVLSREFEPTALRARDIATSRNQSLHELARELGYASAPPAIRKPVDLDSLSRTEVAQRTRYHITDISRLFARKHPPTLTKLARVAAAYGVWMDDMLAALGW